MLVKQVFPLTSNLNWFVTAYVFIYAIGPFLKKAATYLSANKKQYTFLLCVFAIFLSVCGFLTPSNYFYSGILFGIYLVFLGDYVSRNLENISAKKAIAIFAVLICFTICLTFGLRLLATKITVLNSYTGHFIANASPLITVAAICLLLAFSKLRIKSRMINLVASSTLTLYLIHDNTAFKDHVWYDLLKVQNHLDHYIPYMFVCVFLLFCLCLCVELIRKASIGKLIANIIMSPCNKVDDYLSRIQVI